MRIKLAVAVLCAVLAGLAVSTDAVAQFASVPAPTAPSHAAPGTISVTVPVSTPPTPKYFLQEKQGVLGTWTTVSVGLSGGTTQLTRSEGDLYFRTGRQVWSTNGGGLHYVGTDYSVAVETWVSNGPIPTQQPVPTQAKYTYSVKVGDINADGLKDIYIARTSGGVLGDGVVYQIILQQSASHTFAPLPPLAANFSTANGWPAAAISVILDDLNGDGFVDLVLRGVGSIIPGASDQITFSPGKLLNLTPPAITPVDATLTGFLSDAFKWTQTPTYFTTNAPTITVPIYAVGYWCWSTESVDYTWNFGSTCYTYPILVGTQTYQDFSVFNQDAVTLSAGFTIKNGSTLTVQVGAGGAAGVLLNGVFKRIFGVDVLGGVLRDGCGPSHVFTYDSSTSIDCTNQDELGESYISLLYRIASDIGYAVAGCRNITSGEQALANGNIAAIINLPTVRLCPVGYLGLFSNNVMTPDGNIYIGPGSGTTWSTDFSQPGVQLTDKSVIVHELVHTYQVRNLGYSVVMMAAKKAASLAGNGYRYWNPSTGNFYTPSWSNNNIEQQAQSVQDRYLFRNGRTTTYSGLNDGVTLPQLQSFIPF